MNMRNFWLLGFLMLALVFGGFVSSANAQFYIDDMDIEGTSADGDPSGDNYSIRGVKIWLEGGIDERDDELLGNLILRRGDGTEITIMPGSLLDNTNPGHELFGSRGTDVDDTTGEVTTNNDGEFYLTFILPFDAVGNAPDTLTFYFDFIDIDVTPTSPAGDDQFVEYDVQIPEYSDADVDDDVYRNGDEIEFELELETNTAFGGDASGRGIENLTILPDLSNVDSAFAGGNSRDPVTNELLVPLGRVDNDTTQPSGRYDLTSWNPSDTDPNALDLYDLVLDVDRAVREGRLVITDDNRGDYTVLYSISETNVNPPGEKRVFIHAIDFPSYLNIFSLDPDDVELYFTNANLTFPDDLNIATWQTTDDLDGDEDPDTEDINLDNQAPNFDFAVINPFVRPPQARLVDLDGDGTGDEWVYYYKQGDTVSIMVQIDPHDLTSDELEEIDEDQIFADGNEDATIDDITVIGDISALLNPNAVDLTTDINRNGIPDRAEVVASYAGSGGSIVSGSDDDFDGALDDVEDEEDKTTNGFNERYLFVINFTIDNTFKGVSAALLGGGGGGLHTTGPLPMRFLIQDAAGNISNYSSWTEEMYNRDLMRWRPVDIADWGRETDPIEGTPANPVYNPVYYDDVFYPNGDPGHVPPSSISYAPTPQRAKVPQWSNGYRILENWNQPWRLGIDAGIPNVSKFNGLELMVANADPTVIKGGAVLPGTAPAGTNVISNVGTGNYIYEIGGNESNLVTLKVSFPSDNDIDLVKFMYSDTGAPGTYKPMKGMFAGDEIGIDMAGPEKDANFPGAREGLWHDGINGDDDDDNDADLNDDEVNDARLSARTDNRDNDADGLIDSQDVNADGINTEIYDYTRDADEDGIMDEDEYIVKANTANRTASWTFDPVRIARLLNLVPGKAYAIKAVPVDMAGNTSEEAAAPIYLIFNVIGKGVATAEGIAKAVLYRDSTPITEKFIPENRTYTLEATTTGTVNSVTFQYSMDKVNWFNIASDFSAPFRITWVPKLDELANILFMDVNGNGVRDANEPSYEAGDDLYIRAVAGKFGDLGMYKVVSGLTIDTQTFSPYPGNISFPVPEVEQAPDLTVAITDTTAPVLVMLQAGEDIAYNRDGVDNDLDGAIDEDDGSEVDELADGALLPVAKDVLLAAITDPDTWPHDIKDAVFQYALVHPDGTRAQWVDIPGTVDLTIIPGSAVKATSKWDTTTLVPGDVSKRYDIRCVAFDGSGNSAPDLAPILHVVVGKGKYAAFITDPTTGSTVPKTIPFVTVGAGNQSVQATIYNVNPGEQPSIRKVIFQYQKPGGLWTNFDVIQRDPSWDETWEDGHGVDFMSDRSLWYGIWDIRDLSGDYNVRAVVEDDRGYQNQGIEVAVKVEAGALVRAKISNFQSSQTENPRVSMKIARDGSVSAISISARDDIPVEIMKVKLIAEVLYGAPSTITFQYIVNDPNAPVNPKTAPAASWKTIGADTDGAPWEKEWIIDATNAPELVDATVSKLVYVRAVASTANVADQYTDEANFIPYVGLIFEEASEPTCTIERIEVLRNGVTKSVNSFTDELRFTGGQLTFIPHLVDQGISDHRASGVVKVELYRKYMWKGSRSDGTLNWVKVAEDTTPPFAVVMDTANVPLGKYEFMLVATDQAGNKSANVWDLISNLRNRIEIPGREDPDLIRVATIDREGPVAYVEDPDGMSHSNRLHNLDSSADGSKDVLISLTSCAGSIKIVELYYSLTTTTVPAEVRTGEGTYTFQYLDVNDNGVFDPGEPFWILNPPGQGPGIPGDGDGVEQQWIKIGEINYVAPNLATLPTSAIHTGIDGFNGYWYIDSNSNGCLGFDAGETVWMDLLGGNTQKYNYDDHTVKEPILMGGIRPADETPGVGFPGISGKEMTWNFAGVTNPPVKWADVDGYDGKDNDGDGLIDDLDNIEPYERGMLSQGDFIWVDVNNDNLFTEGPGGTAEPIIYTSVSIPWTTIGNLPPTNNSQFDLKARAIDKNDSVDNIGNWGPEYVGPVRVENIQASIVNINGKAVGDFTNIFRRVTGDSVEVTVRVYPEPIAGANVQLWYRYDNGLYPGAPDNPDGYPDNGSILNSRWDGIDNDWDDVPDEEQVDSAGNARKWGEVNTWRLAETSGGATPVSWNVDENWFEVKLVWDVSMLDDEFQYELVPIVVDAQGFGVNIKYPNMPWLTSDAKFPQHPAQTLAGPFVKIIVDHQGPYTYTQVVKNTDNLDAAKKTLNSWLPLTDGSPDDMIIRTNDGVDNDGDGALDEPGENNYVTYDIQAKTVSIFGGFDYTKSFQDQVGGVEFQYRVPGGEWQHLGYDYDPDYMNTFMFNGDVANPAMVVDDRPNNERGLANGDNLYSPNFTGELIPYFGVIKALTNPGDTYDAPGNSVVNVPVVQGMPTTQRVFVATWSLDNVSIQDTVKFPWTNGTEYEFRTIAMDLPDAYGGPKNATGVDPATASAFDERVIRGIVGAGSRVDFLRGIDWKFGAPFGFAGFDSRDDLFDQPLADGVNNRIEYVLGPRNDGKDDKYWVDNLVPRAAIVQVDEKKFAWTPETGVDPVAIAEPIDATIMEGDDVLFEAIVNPDPENKLGSSTWGIEPGDITEVRLYARSVNSGWKQVNSLPNPYPNYQPDYGNRFTFRVNTEELIKLMNLTTSGTRDVTFMAMAKDDNGNEEAFADEIVVRVEDMMGPNILLGGLALDMDHYKEMLDRGEFGVPGAWLRNTAGRFFSDTVGLDLNNFGNGVFPADPAQVAAIWPAPPTFKTRPVAKVSGEWLNLYITNADKKWGEVPENGITISVFDQSNTAVVKPTVVYKRDTKPGDDVIPATVEHKFALSEQVARLYLPTWVEDTGNIQSNFEGVKLFYKVLNNIDGAGSKVGPPTGRTYFSDNVPMTRSFNSKGEPIWNATLNLEAGKTYFYYFEVDTVGDTWLIPDPKNLMGDEFFMTMMEWYETAQRPTWFKSWMWDDSYDMKKTLVTNNLFINLPIISKIWVPGTPKESGSPDDEIWSALIDLNTLPDGVYEIRVEGVDKAGFKDILSKTVVLDRTPPPVDPKADIKVDGRVKANSRTSNNTTPLTAVLHDGDGINAVETISVLFEISRRGNTPDAISTWKYAIAPPTRPVAPPILQNYIDDLKQTYIGAIAVDMDPTDGWSVPWLTPVTDQNVKFYVRAVPFDDALNVQVGQTNQVEVWVDGTVPKAKVVTASVQRGGTVFTEGANGFELHPTDKDVVLTAEMVANIDGDLNLDGVIDPANENVNLGVKGVTFWYSLNEVATIGPDEDSIVWYKIPATQYSDAVRIPNADGKWQVTWQVDFSKIYDKDNDQYIHVRAVAEDDVGNIDSVDPILTIMVLNDITGPDARIKYVDGDNILSPHLAVTKGAEITIEAHNVAAATLEYKAVGATEWTQVKTVTKSAFDVQGYAKISWDVAAMAEGRYNLRVIGYDADGNPTTEPHVVVVIVDHTEPEVSEFKMWVDMDRVDGYEGDEIIYPGSALYRYKNTNGYFNVKIEVKADATDPDDKVEAKEAVLEYFDRSSATWKPVRLADKSKATLTYSAVTDKWSKEFIATDSNPNDTVVYYDRPGMYKLDAQDQLVGLIDRDGLMWFRVLVTDYAGNQNNLDKGYEIMADANAPTVVAVYSGGREWEGGILTHVAYGGDQVDLWAKVIDEGTGVASVVFKVKWIEPDAGGWQDVGAGQLVDTNGAEELWHFKWTTPKNLYGNNNKFKVIAYTADKAGNGATYENPFAEVLIEVDKTAPHPPKVQVAMTIARRATDATEPRAPILDDLNAKSYGRRMLPIVAGVDKYQVFDLINDWLKNSKAYVDPEDQFDTALELWTRTADLEFSVNQDPATSPTILRQYEDYQANAGYPAGANTGPEFFDVANKVFGTDPGVAEVFIDIGYYPDQTVAPSAMNPADVTSWLAFDNLMKNNGYDNSVDLSKKMDPRRRDDAQEPLTRDDVLVIPLRNSANDATSGYAYYWILGDNAQETVWNTEASVNDDGEVLDSVLAKDGYYFIRTRAKDFSGNLGEFGYALIRVHNQDNIPPAGTQVIAVNGETDSAKWPPLEWKWHTVTVRTNRNAVNGWNMGGTASADQTWNKFFGDIDYVVVEALDNESGQWVNVTRGGSQSVPGATTDGAYTEWAVQIDSTLVGDGSSQLRAYAVDNGGILVDGVGGVHTQRDRRNVENKEASATRNILVDNPRAQVVLPDTGSTWERGVDTVQLQAVPVSPGGDPARNGHDVGQVAFLVKRKAAPGGVDGPWILVDAKDSDLDGKFGEPGDPIDPSDTNEPYMVFWTIPDWLVIDDPQTETVVEQSAEYWIVAVAGDSNTGPLDAALGMDQGGDGLDNDNDGYIDEADEGLIHWDSPYHIIKRTTRAALVTIVDHHPPKTRILRVDRYAVPSEVKIIVGKTVTIFAGDTEVSWMPPELFPTPPFDGESFANAYPPVQNSVSPDWPADGAAWAIGLLYPPMYSPDAPWDNEVASPVWSGKQAEWRPDERVTLRYAGPYDVDAVAPAFPTSGQQWEDTAWKTAEANAIHMDDQGNPGNPDWEVTNWVTGGSVLPDGKYFITITATDDVGHTTGIPVGTTEPVMPDMVEIWIKNSVKPITMAASELLVDGTLKLITNNEMERGQPLVLTVDPKMPVEELDKITFQYKVKHDYNWQTVKVVETQPYSVTLSPLGAWSGVTGEPNNIALGNVYQFRALANDLIGNTGESNIIELTVVDRVAMASIAKVKRLDGFNVNDEEVLEPQMIDLPRLTGKVEFSGYTDSDVVGVTFQYRAQGASGANSWTEIEAVFDREPENPGWPTDERLGIDVIFALDSSGSMDWNDPTGQRKVAAKAFVDLLDPDTDQAGVVSWDDNIDFTQALTNDFALVKQRINAVDASGGTDLNVGLNKAIQLLDAGRSGASRVIVFLTNGSGSYSHATAVAAANKGYKIYTIGLGPEPAVDYLRDIANTTGGKYYAATSAEVLEGLFTLIFQRARITSGDPYHYFGNFEWKVIWDTTSLPDGLYEIAVVANTGDSKSNVDKILTVVVDHNAYDIVDAITDSSPKSGGAVGGYTRRPVTSQNPILDPDQKEPTSPRGEVDVYITFGNGLPLDLDMGVPTKQTEPGTALLAALEFQYKESAYPNIGDETRDDKQYWKTIAGSENIVYDAAMKRFSAVWRTVAQQILNGYYDIRVRAVDEAGNVAYKVIAERVVVDNTGPDAMITSINDDTTLTYEGVDMATDTELIQDQVVTVRATAVDSLTSVAYVQFQVKVLRLQSGQSIAGNSDETDVSQFSEWTDVGLATKDANPKDSYSLLWNTSGLFEGDYMLRLKVTDIVGNKAYSKAVIVTVVDNVPPVAAIVGYYPEQLHFANWPKKYWFDTIYAATICQADVQEVLFQYRSMDDERWINIGVSAPVPFENLDSVSEKLDDIHNIAQSLFPPAVARDEAIVEAFDWSGLWGTTWKPQLPDGMYQLRAVAKDWSGNRDPELAPILTVQVVGGVVIPVTPASGMSINFTANLGGTGIGDRSAWWDLENWPPAGTPNYNDMPTVVLTVESAEKPTVLVLAEFNSPTGLAFGGGLIVSQPNGLIFGGELVDVKPEEGASGRWTAALDGDELTTYIEGHEIAIPYLELLRLGGKIIAFATTSNGIVGTTLTMDDIRVFPVTAELGTNGVVFSKDNIVSVTIPRAALLEQQPLPGQPDVTKVERAGLFITPCITPNTPKDQRMIIEPVGQAYNIEMFNYAPKYVGFRPGFEPKITIDYGAFGLPPDAEALGFISVRYWDPQLYGSSNQKDGRWANDDIINLSVDEQAKKVTFNLKSFGHINDAGNLVPHTIFSIVLEKAVGRIDDVAFYHADNTSAFQYPGDLSVSYLKRLAGGRVGFRIVDPAGIDEKSIRVYIDGGLFSVGLEGPNNPSGHVVRVQNTVPVTDNDRAYYFKVPATLDLIEGFHTLKIEAWDKSDVVSETNWLMLEKTVRFYIDRTQPQVVTHTAQPYGVRYFRVPEGATASITIVDEGVGLGAATLQNSIYVDVFKYLTPASTPLRTTDQGNIINYQRKVLQATSKPILEYCDDYTSDGIDNETWVGVHDGASSQRHKAWRASYTVYMGQIADGDTYEVVFYASKPQPTVLDLHNENAVYLYEDLTKAYLAVWDGGTADNLSVSTDMTLMGIVAVPATQVPDFYKLGIANLSFASDPFTGYYRGTFLIDQLGNGRQVNNNQPIVVPADNFTPYVEATTSEDVASVVGSIASIISSVGSSGSSSERLSDQFFVRHLVADTRGPVVKLDVPQGVRADDLAATVSASVVDDGSGIGSAKLVVNGKVVAEKAGPISNVSLEYTFGKGEAERANEIKVVTMDLAGNETVTRASFGVQEVDGPAITDMSPVGDGVSDATPAISAAYSDVSGIDLSSVTLTLNGAVMTDTTVGPAKVSYTPTTPLKAGVTYTVKVSVKDTAGTASEATWTFALETDAPTVADTTPSGVDETGIPVISAKFSDAGTGVNPASVKLMVDKKTVEAEVTASSVSYKSPSVMKKGKHTADLVVADLAGNVANHSWEFSIEETAPTITDVAPSGTINVAMPVLSARYSDAGTGIDVNSVTVALDGELVKATVDEAQVSYAVKEPLTAGVSHTMVVTVADKAGNVGSASSTFRLEGTAPSISNMKPTETVNTVDVAISANYSDAGSGIDKSTALMKLDGVVVAATPSASGISYQAMGLQHGEHTVYVEVADKFGNIANQSWTFKVEETPPTISLVEPKGEINTATPVVQASYSDAGTGINVSSVVLSLNGQVLPATATASQVSYEVLTPLEKGVTYKVAVQVADKAGNIASADSTFSLETTPPKISSTEPTGTVSETDAAKGVMISAKLSDDGSGVNPDSVRMWLDGAPVSVNATAEKASYMAKGLSYGEHNVRLVVADMLGNTADSSWKFSVDDSTPPTVTVISPKQDSVVGVRPVIKISYADEGSGVDLTSISVKIDDKPVVASAMAPADAKVVSAGEASYEVKLGYGSHTLTVAVSDVAGNEATAEVKFMVEGDVLEVVKAHNYPNPFRGDSTNITFGLSKQSRITIKIYDFTATLVATVAEDMVTMASEKVEGFKWDGTTDTAGGRQLANGVYFCQVIAKTDSETKSEIVKIALVRE